MKLNYRKTFLVGLAFMAICAFWQMYDHIVPLMLKYTLGMGEAFSGVIMAADNVLGLFMLPLFGALSDRTNTKIGRRKPFVIFGTVGAVLAMVFIPLADKLYFNSISSQALAAIQASSADEAALRASMLSSGTLAYKVFFVVALGLVLFFMATYRSPAVALMPDITIKTLRSKGNAVINLMGAFGGILILLLIQVLLVEDKGDKIYHPNYVPIFVACMAIMAVSLVMLLLFVDEPKLVKEMQESSRKHGIKEDSSEQSEQYTKGSAMPKDVKKSFAALMMSIAFWFMGYNAVTTAFSRYSVEQFGIGGKESAGVLLIANAAAIISYIPIGALSTKIGRKKTILMGICCLAVSFSGAILAKDFNAFVYILFIIAGFGWAAINVNSYPMVVEMSRGTDVGKFTGYYYTASMAAQTVTPILSGLLLQNVGYQTLFPYAVLFVILAFVSMQFVKHGDSRPSKPSSTLEAFD